MAVSVLYLLADEQLPEAATVQLVGPALAHGGCRVGCVVVGVGSADRSVPGLRSSSGCEQYWLPAFGGRLACAWRDLAALVRQFAPTVVHAVGWTAWQWLTAARLTGALGHPRPRLIVSGVSAPRKDVPGSWLVRLIGRHLLRWADRVVAETRSQADRYVSLGIAPDRIVRVDPPAPLTQQFEQSSPTELGLALPEMDRLIVAEVSGDPWRGGRTAVIAFDMLRYLDPTWHLIVCGAGRHEGTLAGLVRRLAFDDDRVRFLPSVLLEPLPIARAAVVWPFPSPSRFHAVLWAMAAGRPVVTWQTPETAELLTQGETGYLVPPSDPVALAKHTRLLLEDPPAAGRLTRAAQARAASAHLLERATGDYLRLYQGE